MCADGGLTDDDVDVKMMVRVIILDGEAMMMMMMEVVMIWMVGIMLGDDGESGLEGVEAKKRTSHC